MSSKRHQRNKYRSGCCIGKVKHPDYATAKTANGNNKALCPYQCGFCGSFHLGHPIRHLDATQKRFKGKSIKQLEHEERERERVRINAEAKARKAAETPGQFVTWRNGEEHQVPKRALNPQKQTGPSLTQEQAQEAARLRQIQKRREHWWWYSEKSRWHDDGGPMWVPREER